jgi:methyltransferase (TIGR00027 family)
MSLEESKRARIAATTAEGAAALRAAGAAERDPALRCPDELAREFVSWAPRLTSFAKVPLLRGFFPRVAERILPGGYWFEIGRTKHMDAVLLAELDSGVGQVVLLGAGFDSRPYRFADRLREVAVFEVDHPVTAAMKREKLMRIFGRVPEHVAYVEVDFTRDDLGERLRSAGFEPELPAFLVWSGVTPYVPEPGVRAVLDYLASLAPGTSIVFDYCFREMIEGDDGYHGAAELRRRVAQIGEPLVFGIPEGTAALFLAEHGLKLESELDPEEFVRRYLTRTDGTVAGKPYGFGAIAHARVP